LAAAAGCTADGGRRDDPLLGGGLRPGNQPVAVATANPPGGSTVAPPAPAYQPKTPLTPGTPTSNAALAGGGFQPLPGGSDLRIGSGALASGNVQLQQPAFTDPRGPAPVPPPSGPVPVPVPPPGSGGGAVVPVSAPRGGGLEQALAAAAARNPLYYKFQFNSQTREYTFIMSVPDRLNTSVQRTVEATAASPVEAVNRALEQLGAGA
jgi:hypothetical protein